MTPSLAPNELMPIFLQPLFHIQSNSVCPPNPQGWRNRLIMGITITYLAYSYV